MGTLPTYAVLRVIRTSNCEFGSYEGLIIPQLADNSGGALTYLRVNNGSKTIYYGVLSPCSRWAKRFLIYKSGIITDNYTSYRSYTYI